MADATAPKPLGKPVIFATSVRREQPPEPATSTPAHTRLAPIHPPPRASGHTPIRLSPRCKPHLLARHPVPPIAPAWPLNPVGPGRHLRLDRRPPFQHHRRAHEPLHDEGGSVCTETFHAVRL